MSLLEGVGGTCFFAFPGVRRPPACFDLWLLRLPSQRTESRTSTSPSLALLPSSCKDTYDGIGPTWIMFPSQGPQINDTCKIECGVLVRHPVWSKPLAFKAHMGELNGSHNLGQGGIERWILGSKNSRHIFNSPPVSAHSSSHLVHPHYPGSGCLGWALFLRLQDPVR